MAVFTLDPDLVRHLGLRRGGRRWRRARRRLVRKMIARALEFTAEEMRRKVLGLRTWL